MKTFLKTLILLVLSLALVLALLSCTQQEIDDDEEWTLGDATPQTGSYARPSSNDDGDSNVASSGDKLVTPVVPLD